MPGLSFNGSCTVVIEDEAPIRRFLRASLRAEGFRVAEAATARDALRLITQERPALILLDLGLPGGDGVSIIREVREWSAVPVIVLSARGDEKNKIHALDAGADDYLAKPFGVGELLARIRVAMRHAARVQQDGAEQSSLQTGPLHFDFAARRVLVEDRDVKLMRIEFDLLAILARNAGKVLTHRFLLKEVWGPHCVDEPHYVRVFMGQLRKKPERNPSRPEILMTEQGVGCRLKCG